VSPSPIDIVILGGGTAGWIAANLFAQRWGDGRARVTVIESSEIGIIGVGEGSTPQLKALFDRLGLAERDWMPRCNATYKTGIAFHGWSQRAGFGAYFHPFPTLIDGHSAPLFYDRAAIRRRGGDVYAHPDRFFLPAWLARHRLAPIAAENFPFDVSYGYHFDAYLVGAMLRDHAVAAGVTHLDRRIASVELGQDGDVAALIAEGGERIAGDIFVDCSGFAGVIAQQALGVRFQPFAANLFNDSAVVMPTPPDATGTNCHTKSTALSAGWAWDIPLTNRTGNGYVYSSRYLDADAAEAELRAHLGLSEADVPVRHLKMKVGRLERSWVANCLAVGLSQGFIEPLEATALHIVQATVEGFILAYERGGFTPAHRDAFNADIARRYEGIRDYIVCHYRVNQRTDTAYWRDNAANHALSDSLKAMMTCWFTGGDVAAEIDRQDIGHYYSTLSWHCLFAGYGTFPDDARLQPVPDGYALDEVDRFIQRCALNFAPHDAQLAALETI